MTVVRLRTMTKAALPQTVWLTRSPRSVYQDVVQMWLGRPELDIDIWTSDDPWDPVTFGGWQRFRELFPEAPRVRAGRCVRWTWTEEGLEKAHA